MNATVAATGIDRAMLICGLVAMALFAITDLLGAALWKGYHPVTQSISELVAQGAPTRGVLLPLEVLRHLLMLAFAAGVWPATRATRRGRADERVLWDVVVARANRLLPTSAHLASQGQSTRQRMAAPALRLQRAAGRGGWVDGSCRRSQKSGL